ncbi:MAG: type II toxin-antitoxin system VapC family toxin [Bryobacterales bacterium]
MMLDSSALVCLILGEPGHVELQQRMLAAPLLTVGAPTLVEAAFVLTTRLRRDVRPLLNEFLREAEVEVVPFERNHFDAAVDAFLRYGKGRHAAALNFGDCLSYAMARVAGMPLLYTGKDFSRTDLARVE